MASLLEGSAPPGLESLLRSSVTRRHLWILDLSLGFLLVDEGLEMLLVGR